MRKRPIDELEIARTIEREFSLPTIEMRLYLRLLTTDLGLEQVAKELGVTQSEALVLAGKMLDKGLLIRSSTKDAEYVPLHPRMVLTNIFKMFEKDLVQSLRDRRATVDRVVNVLTPIYEERKGLS